MRRSLGTAPSTTPKSATEAGMARIAAAIRETVKWRGRRPRASTHSLWSIGPTYTLRRCRQVFAGERVTGMMEHARSILERRVSSSPLHEEHLRQQQQPTVDPADGRDAIGADS